MFIAFILLGALPATLFFISKLGLSNPPQEHLTIEVAEVRVARVSREDIQLAA
ncbi:hypothetical protein MCEMRE182_00863 [Candidatus Nanopelagicaceae bacterium]